MAGAERVAARDGAQLRIYVQDWDVDLRGGTDYFRVQGGTDNPDFLSNKSLPLPRACGAFKGFAAQRVGNNSGQQTVLAQACELPGAYPPTRPPPPPLLSPRASSHPSHVSPEAQYRAPPFPPGRSPPPSPLLFVSAPARAPHRQRCRAPSHVAARSRIFYYEPARALTSPPAPLRPPSAPTPSLTLPRALLCCRALSYAAARAVL